MLTIDRIRQVNIPINVSNKPNNLSDNIRGLNLYNDSVSLYDAILLVVGNTSGSSTDLTNTPSSSNVLINSSTGTDTTVAAASTTLAGVMSATDKVNLNALGTLTGVSLGALNLGTFTGNIIPDNVTIKAALQALETTTQAIPVITKGNLTSSTAAVTVTNGTNSVIGTGTSLTFNPGSVLLSTLGGTLNYSQLSVSGASSGQLLAFNGTNWAPFTFTVVTPPHNNLTGKQGGTSGEYYHITEDLHDLITNANANKLIGRVSTAGPIQELTLGGSLAFNSTAVQLSNDNLTPGNTMYYGTNGSGVKGWYSAIFSGVTSLSATDSSEIDFTITNPTTTPNITGILINSGVTAGTYGTSSAVPVIGVDLKGRITSAINTTISIPSTSVSDFSEAVDDRVAALVTAGTGISVVYDDTLETLTIGNTLTSTGVANRISWWLNSTTLTTDNDLTFDGTYMTIGTNTTSSLSRLTTKGLGNSLSTYGIVHQSSVGTDVFKLADNGAILLGGFGEVYVSPSIHQITTGGTYAISKSGGDLQLDSDTTVVVTGGGQASNTPSFISKADRSTSVGTLYNAQIIGTVGLSLGGTNPYTDLLIETHIDQGLHTGIIRGAHIKPVITTVNNYRALDLDAPTSEHALYVTSGKIRLGIPSFAEGDIMYVNSSGDLARLAIGGSMEVLGSNGTIPVWTTTAGSLPGGSNGDFLIYAGGSWVSGSPQREKITGITGTGITLAATPLASVPLMVFRNGVLQDDPEDYSILGNVITLVLALATTDKITVIYYI